MPGVGEILILLVLAFVVFGPRKRGERPSPLWRALLLAVATAVPPLLVTDLVAGTMGLPTAARLRIDGAALGGTLGALLLVSMIQRLPRR